MDDNETPTATSAFSGGHPELRDGDNGAGGDYFRADRAWLYVTMLTIGYLVGRGLAKSVSRAAHNG
ncbi:hypothetical protein [Micromonospora sp. NPDC049240]|uniref:hypothetical protein n=1 Tax=Micromonospora sp. NPDC049240 TaxID=3155151 RepID=UPI0033D72266